MTLAGIIRRARAPGRSKQNSCPGERKIILFGDSHSYAVQRAIEKRLGKGREAPLTAHRLSKIKDGRLQGDTTFEEFLQTIRSLRSDDIVLSMIGGNQHAVFSTIQHPQPFDFYDPDGFDPMDPAREIIPYRMVSGLFRKWIRDRDAKSLQALRQATKARVIHIVPPPPKADNGFLKEYHEAAFADASIASSGVSSPSLRLKSWKLQMRVLKKICAKLDIEVMMPPARALDRDGFLAADFCAKDVTHANYVYGELVLRQIEQRFPAKQNDASGQQ